MKKIIKDSKETLEAGIKAEKETILQYTRYLQMAKDNNNLPEARLWEHIIKDEEEHVKEFQNALKGDFDIHDSEEEKYVVVASDNPYINYNMFIYNEDQIRTFYAKGQIYIAFEGTEEECNNWVEQAEAEDEESYPDAGADLTNYVVLEGSALDDHYKIDKAYNMKRNKKNVFGTDSDPDGDEIIITKRSKEWVARRQEKIEDFEDRIENVLIDAGIKRGSFSLQEEYPWFYCDFGDEKELAEKAYQALRDDFFDADLVDDDGFYFVSIKRR